MRWSRRKRLNKIKEEKARARKKRIAIAAGAILGAVALDVAYVKIMDGRFYHRATLNGYDVSGRTAAEVAELLADPYNRLSLSVQEKGEEVLSTSFADMGFQVDRSRLSEAISACIDAQNPVAYLPLALGGDYGVRVPFLVDQPAFQASVCADRLSKPRVATKDATLVQDGGSYRIDPEVYGTTFADTDLRGLVSQTVTDSLEKGNVASRVTVQIPESLYEQPQILSDNADLRAWKDLYNQFCNARIAYQFGDQEQILGWDTIRGWLSLDGANGPVDTEAAYQYVLDLAGTYDTYGLPRTFESTWRGTITIGYNSYGYQIDVDGEFGQLLADIHANQPVSREPVYARVGYNRDGVDDLNGTYVEVDLSQQYLWFYKHGDLIVETPIISGLPTEERATHEGVFTIPYKASPFQLKGQGGAGMGEGWDVEVQYWMPFDDGQGLHDASWQAYFGGETYKTAGSHGCINLPVAEAAAIYQEMEDNVCILIYQ